MVGPPGVRVHSNESGVLRHVHLTVFCPCDFGPAILARRGRFEVSLAAWECALRNVRVTWLVMARWQVTCRSNHLTAGSEYDQNRGPEYAQPEYSIFILQEMPRAAHIMKENLPQLCRSGIRENGPEK